MTHAHLSRVDRDESVLTGSVPMRRLGTADEVAAAVVWLLSPESAYVTGHCLTADGGYLA